MTTGFFYHPDFLKHDTGPGHPERKDRLEAILRKFNKKRARHALPLQEKNDFGEASLEQMSRVHDIDYLSFLAKTEGKDFFALDPDTTGCSQSWQAARLAAGAVIKAVEEVHKRNLKNAFCAVRPPGHHAERDKAMGFCFVNNVAAAAAHLVEEFSYSCILVVDWDAHHGNGTQHIFYAEPRVFYYSSHQYPFYPGTGAALKSGREREREVH